MNQAIVSMLPYAVGVALSPLPIVAVILMLLSKKAKLNSVVFVLGWILGVSIILAIVLYILTGQSTITIDHSSSNRILTILGLVLVFMAFRRFIKRPKPGQQPSVPKWLAAIDTFSPVKAFLLAIVLVALNLKNLPLIIAGGIAISEVNGSASETTVAAVVFVITAVITVVAPAIFYLVAGNKITKQMTDIKQWLIYNNSTILAVLFLIIGIFLLAKGLGK